MDITDNAMRGQRCKMQRKVEGPRTIDIPPISPSTGIKETRRVQRGNSGEVYEKSGA